MTGLFDGTFARGGAALAVSDDAWFRALLDVEAALARAAARVGLVPTTAADAVTEAARTPAGWTSRRSSRRPRTPGTRCRRWSGCCRTPWGSGDAAPCTWARPARTSSTPPWCCSPANALAAIDADLTAAAGAAARLAAAHRDDVVMGRTLLQQALPTTFGLKAAGWLAGLDGARLRLAEVVASLPVQYGGAAGTLAASVRLGRRRCGRRSPRSWGWPTPPSRGTPCGCRSPTSPAPWARPPGWSPRSPSTSCCWRRPRSAR